MEQIIVAIIAMLGSVYGIILSESYNVIKSAPDIDFSNLNLVNLPASFWVNTGTIVIDTVFPTSIFSPTPVNSKVGYL